MNKNMHEEFQQLFDTIPEISNVDITFMEIAGYPHYENVCSNILKFFLNPKIKQNCFGDLLLKSLLQSAKKLHAPFTEFENITIKREVVTNNGRLDLVLYTNKWVIGIENKIKHTLENDLEEYSQFLEKQYNGREILKIVLSIRGEKNLKGGFINITYKDFIETAEANLSNCVIDINNQYYVFFIHFLQTIKNMFMTTGMDKEQINFLINNQAKIDQIIELKCKLENYIRYRAYKIMDAINFGENYKKWVHENYDVGFHFIHGDVKYKLECPITKHEIQIKLCVEQNRIDYAELKKLDLFKKNDIANYQCDEGNNKLLLEQNIDFFISDDDLIKKLEGYLADLKITDVANVPLKEITDEQLN